MSKSIDFIENESFVVVNPDYPVISKENALIAVDIADKEAKDKAIEVYKNTCSFSPIGCCMMKKEAGKCDCDNLNDFIEELNS